MPGGTVAEMLEVRRVELIWEPRTIWSRAMEVAANLPSTSSILDGAPAGAKALGKALMARASALMAVNCGMSRVAVTTYTWGTVWLAAAAERRPMPRTMTKAPAASKAPQAISIVPARFPANSFESGLALFPDMSSYLSSKGLERVLRAPPRARLHGIGQAGSGCVGVHGDDVAAQALQDEQRRRRDEQEDQGVLHQALPPLVASHPARRIPAVIIRLDLPAHVIRHFLRPSATVCWCLHGLLRVRSPFGSSCRCG